MYIYICMYIIYILIFIYITFSLLKFCGACYAISAVSRFERQFNSVIVDLVYNIFYIAFTCSVYLFFFFLLCSNF